MDENQKWMSFKRKTNHIIAKLPNGKEAPLCNSYALDDYPSVNWSEEIGRKNYCGKCALIDKNNIYTRRHPGRETLPKNRLY